MCVCILHADALLFNANSQYRTYSALVNWTKNDKDNNTLYGVYNRSIFWKKQVFILDNDYIYKNNVSMRDPAFLLK